MLENRYSCSYYCCRRHRYTPNYLSMIVRSCSPVMIQPLCHMPWVPTELYRCVAVDFLPMSAIHCHSVLAISWATCHSVARVALPPTRLRFVLVVVVRTSVNQSHFQYCCYVEWVVAVSGSNCSPNLAVTILCVWMF